MVGSRFTGDSVLVDFFCVKVFDQLYSADRVTRFSRFYKGMGRASDCYLKFGLLAPERTQFTGKKFQRAQTYRAIFRYSFANAAKQQT